MEPEDLFTPGKGQATCSGTPWWDKMSFLSPPRKPVGRILKKNGRIWAILDGGKKDGIQTIPKDPTVV